jgi:hypothetical protein
MTSNSIHQQIIKDDTDLPLTLQQQEDLITSDPNAIISDLQDEIDDDFQLAGFRERRIQEMRLQLVHLHSSLYILRFNNNITT